MKNNVNRLTVALSLVVLALAFTGALPAEEDAKDLALSGTLSETEDGGFILVEQESGEAISLRGPDALGDHTGAAVKVVGQWVKDDDGDEYFWVKTVEPLG